MPRGQPFTLMCQQLATLSRGPAADLHAHTTASDGDFSPEQLVLAARSAGIRVVAVTDHDTTAGVGPARAAAAALPRPGRPEVVCGVEISAEFEGREVHLLGLLVRPDDPALTAALADVCASRRDRFRDYVAHLPALRGAAAAGLDRLTEEATASPGRRHVAGLLVRVGAAKSPGEAFRAFLAPVAAGVRPKRLIPVGHAIRLVRGAGGVAALAHPPADCDEAVLGRLRDLGMRAVEANHPAHGYEHRDRLHRWAARLDLAVTGGSDTHGPGRAVGTAGVTAAEWDELRRRAGN